MAAITTQAERDRAVASLLGYDSDEEEEETVQPDPKLIQCGGACGKKHPPENIVRCENGHPICFEDARAYTTTQLGKGVPVLKCIISTCDKIYPGTEVLRYIDLNLFKGVPKERLEIMIQRVGVKDLVELCPNCTTVIVCGPRPQSGNGIIKCTNTTCNRISCRKCKRLSHGDEDCDVAIKKSLECGHCQKVYPASEIVRCEVGHPFCLQAAKDYLNKQLGSGVPVLKCLHPGCDKIFPGTEVLRFIDLNVFKGRPKATLEVMIERVGLKGLVEICPNCITVVECGPIEKNEILKCTNPTCGKSYCRKCNKDSHTPLTCEENANPNKGKGAGKTGSSSIEDELTAAIHAKGIENYLDSSIFRVCNTPRCGKKLFKQDDHNLLYCYSCNKAQCYLCRKTVTDEDHYLQDGVSCKGQT